MKRRSYNCTKWRTQESYSAITYTGGSSRTSNSLSRCFIRYNQFYTEASTPYHNKNIHKSHSVLLKVKNATDKVYGNLMSFQKLEESLQNTEEDSSNAANFNLNKCFSKAREHLKDSIKHYIVQLQTNPKSFHHLKEAILPYINNNKIRISPTRNYYFKPKHHNSTMLPYNDSKSIGLIYPRYSRTNKLKSMLNPSAH